MRRLAPVAACVALALAAGCSGGSGAGGGELFATHCAGCHPQGGNTVHPEKTLARTRREANGIRTARDVAAYIRNPGPGMPAFGEAMIPPADALKIGEYVVASFP
ncbi:MULTISPECIES: c-type cytochrome [Geobacter]|uniref:c-type cytochrome n=1 Tax=Geobacter TaxID=28231 RepID=UPI002573C85B|nr:c-type cytochrome [Geobacter sulfurreducens]BEH09619.1 c-type cytochrome [Geobacter sulfurreducens subsp. ethanolicus]BET57499.1 c-type cytochrome [Geobacter sp. 60473]HML78725.1 c-type cytochrome [Geobacter sulfurreducens]